jgi:Tol biopolymer transport system component
MRWPDSIRSSTASALGRRSLPAVWRPALLLGIALLLAASAPAAGDVFEPISLVSTTPTEQVNSAEHPAISGDGRYLAFDGSVAGMTGVWRRDLLSGSVQRVAVADGGDPAISAPDAQLPSISADGRFVSFTTTASLDPANDANAAPDVYVRDMDIDPHVSGAYTIASAADRSSHGLSYDFAGQQSFGRGSLASGRSALTADGRRVAFVTTAVSNLADPTSTDTPPLQVAVRDLNTQRTQLVSVEYDPSTGAMNGKPVPASIEGGASYGAVYPGGAQVPAFPSPFEGASISADGSTVAWMGQSIGKQSRVLPVDPAGAASYSEPLWRRIADGDQALTRRVTGGSDTANPDCRPGEVQLPQPPQLTDACQGPFEPVHESGGLGVFTLANANQLPQLSADGRTVAFLANAREIASGEEFGSAANATDDLYVVNMSDGLSRVRALRRLTEIASSNLSDSGRVAPIVDLGVSPDGSEVAFSTLRTTFPLGSPAYVSTRAANAVAQELFDVDLDNETLTRVTQGYEGNFSEPSNALTRSPSFTSDGNTLAFSSTSSNLVYGDGNGASDAFVVKRVRFPATIVQQLISAAPANPGTRADWRLSASARSRRDGSVLLEVAVPGAGSLRAGAESAVRLTSSRGRRPAAHHAGASRRSSTTVATRRVAAAGKVIRASAGVLTSLALTPARRYRALPSRRGGLSATVSLVFLAPGHKPLRARLFVTFVRKAHARRSRSSRATRSAGTARLTGARGSGR